jgi:hypothetical protein
MLIVAIVCTLVVAIVYMMLCSILIMSHFFIVEQSRQKQLCVFVNNECDDRRWDNSDRIRDDSVSILAVHLFSQFL